MPRPWLVKGFVDPVPPRRRLPWLVKGFVDPAPLVPRPLRLGKGFVDPSPLPQRAPRCCAHTPRGVVDLLDRFRSSRSASYPPGVCAQA
jgi:hypothetical protein